MNLLTKYGANGADLSTPSLNNGGEIGYKRSYGNVNNTNSRGLDSNGSITLSSDVKPRRTDSEKKLLSAPRWSGGKQEDG